MPEENKKSKKGSSFLKLALFLIILAIIAVVVLYSFFDISPSELFTKGFSGVYDSIASNTEGIDKLKETVKPIMTFDLNERIYCIPASKDLVVASTSYVRILDSEGIEKSYIPVTLKKPFVMSYDNEILVADLEGRYFALIYNGRIVWEKNIDENIVNASISDNWVILITQSKQSGYKRSIRAYSKDGQEVSLRNVSNYYPFKAYSLPEYNPGCFMLSSIEVSGLEANGLFEFFDCSMNQKASIRGLNEIFGGAYPLKENNLFLFAERSVMAINNAYQTIWNNKYKDFTVTAANVINDEFPVVALLNADILSREKHYETTIKIYNKDGTEKADYKVNGNVSAISTKNKTAAVLAESEVFFINYKGELMDKYTAKSNIESVHFGKDNVAYVVTSDTITRVNVKTRDKFLGIF